VVSLFFRKILEHRLHVFILLLTMTILFGLFVLGAQPFAVGLIPVRGTRWRMPGYLPCWRCALVWQVVGVAGAVGA
jgi:hypothetical protein